jgi:filamentous hemagglutinin
MAAVDPAKFSNYAFVTSKAPVFEAGGYSAADSLDLSAEYAQQAADKYLSGDFTLGKADQWGQRINIRIELPGQGGGSPLSVNSGWMIQADEPSP